MIVKLLTEGHLELLSLKGCCRGSSEFKHVKMSLCWKSHTLAHIRVLTIDGIPTHCCHQLCEFFFRITFFNCG